MAADEDVEQLIVEPLRAAGNLLNLQSRLDVQVIADVTRLEIKVDDADRAVTRGFAGLQMRRDLNRQRRIADSPRARRKTHDDRLTSICGTRLGPAALPRHDIDNLLRNGRRRYPIGAAGTHQPLVVARGDIVTDHDEEAALSVTACQLDKLAKIAAVFWRREHENRALLPRFPRQGLRDFVHPAQSDEVGNDGSDLV